MANTTLQLGYVAGSVPCSRLLHLFLANQLAFRAHPLVRRRDGHLLPGGSFLVAEPGVVGKLMQRGFNSARI